MVACPSCAAENPDGKRFCSECGQSLALACPSCRAAVGPEQRFCGDCGAALTGATPAPASTPAPPEAPKRVAERRLTTILFGDLVGFTTLSESRDAEDVRELLSRYFAMANTVVSRYGGTIEKFIGDAVMAVWGVPVAHEDDAERAVRAGLDLVVELAVLADSLGVEHLDMRVGILTGEVAVTLGAVGEGMVAGDAVNTAARIQAVAGPGQVWVDDTTRSLTAAAVAYTDVGDHVLKGKAEPVHLFAAGAVVASVGGAQRVDGLEAPFVGRDHELRMVKELFHAALDEGRPRLVAVSGLAGVGKTRLAWEYEKYVDGISALVRWHRSRVLSYGDGVSFWAIAEMVRSRLGVVDGDAPSVVGEKLTAWLEQSVAEPSERQRLQPRLAVLLGLEAGRVEGFARDDLFSAWASFFEHLSAGHKGVVLVLDDMQYADPDLLDFLDHLLESARYTVFVLALARPELLDGRPGWGTGRRATTVHLEPLGEPAMVAIVNGLVHGLPDQAAHSLVERSEGIPLYALEMVRGLIDRDAVIPHEGRYVLAPDADQRVDLTTLDAPPSLQALIGARLDALAPAERQLVQDASVHGLAFSRDGIAFVSEVPDLHAVLDQLVRKEIFEVHADRFSAERGQYRFLQALVRTVAYDTLSRRDRKVRHLAVAQYLEQTSQGDEVAAVIARHYIDALDSGPDDPDARELVALALEQLERAGRRAEALGSPDEALRHYTTALARQPDLADRARVLEGAARAAASSARPEEAIQHAEEARTAYEALGRPIDAGRAVAILGDAMSYLGQYQASIDLLSPVYEELLRVPDADEAILLVAENLARAHTNIGEPVLAQPYADHALQLAEARQDWERVVSLLGRHAVIWVLTARPTGSLALLRAAVDLGRRHGLPRAMITPLLNTSAFLKNHELQPALAAGREAIEMATKVGALDRRSIAASNIALVCWVSGDWDEALALEAQYGDDLGAGIDTLILRFVGAVIRDARGEQSDLGLDIPEVGGYVVGSYPKLLAEGVRAASLGDRQAAAEAYAGAVDNAYEASGIDDDFAIVWPVAVESALSNGQVDEAQRFLAYVADAPPGLVTPLAHAHLLRIRALVGAATGVDEAEIDADLAGAAVELRDLGARFYLGRALLERAQRMVARGDDEAAVPLFDEARTVFQELKAERWVAETQQVSSPR